MREILFRGKRVDNGKWVEGRLLCDSLIVPKGQPVSLWEDIIDCGLTAYDVDPETVGQYIGLNDKNGRKIFEGDLLRAWSSYNEEYYSCGLVEYGAFNCSCCDGVYGWYLNGGDIRDLSCETYMEVFGNIHDDPGMLE